MRYSVLTFDLDGTLVDTVDEIAVAVNRALPRLGRSPVSLAAVRATVGHGVVETLRRVLVQHNPDGATLPDAETLRKIIMAEYAVTAGSGCTPYPGCRSMLDDLRAQGLRLGLVTNKDRRFAMQVLEHCDLLKSFDLVIGGDTLPVRKPARAVLDHAIQVLGGEHARAAHLGDSRTDVDCAKNAGVEAWAVPWGYDGGEPVAQTGPDRLFTSLAEVASFVRRVNAAHGRGDAP